MLITKDMVSSLAKKDRDLALTIGTILVNPMAGAIFVGLPIVLLGEVARFFHAPHFLTIIMQVVLGVGCFVWWMYQTVNAMKWAARKD